MSTKPCEKISISLPPAMRADAEVRAYVKYRGNLSAYVQDLLAADLAKIPISSAVSPTVLADLTHVYCGYLEPQMSEVLRRVPVPQPQLMYQLLVSFLIAHGADLNSAQPPTAALN